MREGCGGRRSRGGRWLGAGRLALPAAPAAAAALGSLGRRSAGDDVEIHVFRRDELLVFKLTLAGPVVDKVSLKLSLKAGNAALKLRQGWLGVAKKR